MPSWAEVLQLIIEAKVKRQKQDGMVYIFRDYLIEYAPSSWGQVKETSISKVGEPRNCGAKNFRSINLF